MKKRSSGQRIRWMAGLLLCEAILSSAFPVLADERIEQAGRYGEYYRHPSQTITAHTSELEERLEQKRSRRPLFQDVRQK